MYYGINCAGSKVTSVTPKRLLKTQAENLFRPIFLVLSSMKNLREHLFYKVAQGIVTVIVRVIRSFSLGPTRSMKTISR